MGVLSITITLNWGRERLNLELREAASAGICGLSSTSPWVEQKDEARQAIGAWKFSVMLTRRMQTSHCIQAVAHGSQEVTAHPSSS